ncbi:MAG: HD domain-containing protein, partial [Candidatus Subteraquimicrobiales bacterium]|nr:HD domain-containing protein [Candidatus Subteraquimicrobiales bacterium]
SLSQGGSISVATAPILAAIFLLSLPNALFATAFGFFLVVIYKGIKLKSAGNYLISLAQTIIVVSLTGLFFHLLGGDAQSINLISTIRLFEIPSKEVLFAFAPVICSSIFYFFADTSLSQLLFSYEKGVAFIYAWRGAAQLLDSIYIALSFSGLLISLLYHSVGYWSAPLFVVPLFVVRYSFKLFLGIKETYRETIKALGRSIEMQDSVRSGHAERVADYTISIARELGVYGDDLETLGYAAYLHDIGKVGLEEDTLDSVLDSSEVLEGEPLHAQKGAEILREIEYLKDTSDIVLKHHSLFDEGRKKATEIPLGARIINIAAFFDELVNIRPAGDLLTPPQALAKIRKEQGLRFDPKAVRALAKVLKRQGYAVSA